MEMFIVLLGLVAIVGLLLVSIAFGRERREADRRVRERTAMRLRALDADGLIGTDPYLTRIAREGRFHTTRVDYGARSH